MISTIKGDLLTANGYILHQVNCRGVMGAGVAKAWPERFLKAIKPGADLQWVWADFAAWMMDDAEWGLAHKADAELKTLMLEIAQRYRARQTAGKGADALNDKLWAARAARDARAPFIKASSEKLLELLAAAPVVEHTPA